MNNEFNNQGMNQFQNNNNFNNGYVNNQNNKNDNWKNVLIGVMAVIIVSLAALTIYVAVDKKDNNLDNNKDNNQQEENNDNIGSDSTQLGDEVLDEYYLTNTDIIDVHMQKYKYSSLIDDENRVSYSEFYKASTVKNIIDSLEPISNVGDCVNETNHINDEYDKNGVKYPNYCDEDTPFYDCVEEYAKSFGLTVNEIGKMDKKVWSTPAGGGFCHSMYDANIVKERSLDLYNNLFSSSFTVYLDNRIYGDSEFYAYDKNLDKIIKSNMGGTANFYESVIIDSKEENNLYKVKFAEGNFEPGEAGKWIESSINKEISNVNDAKSFVERNKEKLSNYEVTFEKVSTGYKFKEIKKVS